MVSPPRPLSAAFSDAFHSVDAESLSTLWAALDADLVAVRSSWALEDGHQLSFAGLFQTSLGVRPSGLQDAVEGCWDQAFKTHGHLLGYHAVHQSTPSMALIAQRMVEATVAGVAFSANLLTGATDEVCQRDVGLGIAVASDLVDPDVYILNRMAQSFTKSTLEEDSTALIHLARGSSPKMSLRSSVRARV